MGGRDLGRVSWVAVALVVTVTSWVDHPGAAIASSSGRASGSEVRSPASADEVATLAGERCIGTAGRPLVRCVFETRRATRRIAVLGDSKMHQWLPALETLARRHSWDLVTMLVSGCPYVAVRTEREGRFDTACAASNAHRRRVLATEDVDVVMVSQRSPRARVPTGSFREPQEVMTSELIRQWRAWRERGLEVVVVLDNPAPPHEVADCVERSPPGRRDCGFPTRPAVASSAATVQRRAALAVPGVVVVDPTPWICAPEWCDPVRGGRSMYRAGSHLAASSVRSFIDEFDQAFGRAPGPVFDPMTLLDDVLASRTRPSGAGTGTGIPRSGATPGKFMAD